MQMVSGFWQPWWSEKTIAEAIHSANGLAFVWEHNSQILGFVCAHDLAFRAYLSELVVDVHARHQGIGTRLVQAVEDALSSRDQRVLIADVWHDSGPSIDRWVGDHQMSSFSDNDCSFWIEFPLSKSQLSVQLFLDGRQAGSYSVTSGLHVIRQEDAVAFNSREVTSASR